jgi:hypothetical protein
MLPRFPGELLDDGGNGPSRGLQAEIKGFGQGRQPLAQAKRFAQQGRLMAGMQILHAGPARHGGIVRQQIRRGRGSASCRVDEIEPDRVTQQGELGVGDDS